MYEGNALHIVIIHPRFFGTLSQITDSDTSRNKGKIKPTHDIPVELFIK